MLKTSFLRSLLFVYSDVFGSNIIPQNHNLHPLFPDFVARKFSKELSRNSKHHDLGQGGSELVSQRQVNDASNDALNDLENSIQKLSEPEEEAEEDLEREFRDYVHSDLRFFRTKERADPLPSQEKCWSIVRANLKDAYPNSPDWVDDISDEGLLVHCCTNEGRWNAYVEHPECWGPRTISTQMTQKNAKGKDSLKEAPPVLKVVRLTADNHGRDSVSPNDISHGKSSGGRASGNFMLDSVNGGDFMFSSVNMRGHREDYVFRSEDYSNSAYLETAARNFQRGTLREDMIDCCFPNLGNALEIPLHQRPQWMLEAIDKDLQDAFPDLGPDLRDHSDHHSSGEHSFAHDHRISVRKTMNSLKHSKKKGTSRKTYPKRKEKVAETIKRNENVGETTEANAEIITHTTKDPLKERFCPGLLRTQNRLRLNRLRRHLGLNSKSNSQSDSRLNSMLTFRERLCLARNATTRSSTSPGVSLETTSEPPMEGGIYLAHYSVDFTRGVVLRDASTFHSRLTHEQDQVYRVLARYHSARLNAESTATLSSTTAEGERPSSTLRPVSFLATTAESAWEGGKIFGVPIITGSGKVMFPHFKNNWIRGPSLFATHSWQRRANYEAKIGLLELGEGGQELPWKSRIPKAMFRGTGANYDCSGFPSTRGTHDMAHQGGHVDGESDSIYYHLLNGLEENYVNNLDSPTRSSKSSGQIVWEEIRRLRSLRSLYGINATLPESRTGRSWAESSSEKDAWHRVRMGPSIAEGGDNETTDGRLREDNCQENHHGRFVSAHHRARIVLLSMRYPDLIDARKQRQGPRVFANETKRVRPNVARATIKDQLQYKYLVDVMNMNPSGRFVWMTQAKVLVFRPTVVIFANWQELLIPYVNYIPIKSDFSDLVVKILWARANDVLCEKIAENWKATFSEKMSYESQFLYMDTLLQKLGQKAQQQAEAAPNQNSPAGKNVRESINVRGVIVNDDFLGRLPLLRKEIFEEVDRPIAIGTRPIRTKSNGPLDGNFVLTCGADGMRVMSLKKWRNDDSANVHSTKGDSNDEVELRDWWVTSDTLSPSRAGYDMYSGECVFNFIPAEKSEEALEKSQKAARKFWLKDGEGESYPRFILTASTSTVRCDHANGLSPLNRMYLADSDSQVQGGAENDSQTQESVANKGCSISKAWTRTCRVDDSQHPEKSRGTFISILDARQGILYRLGVFKTFLSVTHESKIQFFHPRFSAGNEQILLESAHEDFSEEQRSRQTYSIDVALFFRKLYEAENGDKGLFKTQDTDSNSRSSWSTDLECELSEQSSTFRTLLKAKMSSFES